MINPPKGFFFFKSRTPLKEGESFVSHNNNFISVVIANKDHHARRVLKSEIFALLVISLPYVLLTQHWAVHGISQQCSTRNKQARIVFLDVQVFAALERDNELMRETSK